MPQKIDTFVRIVQHESPNTPLEEARSMFPRMFEVHGHVVVVRMNKGVDVDTFRPFAKAFALSFRPVVVNVVLLDTDGIKGELRRPTLEALYNSQEGAAYRLAFARIIRKQWSAQHKQQLTLHTSEEEMNGLLSSWADSDTFTVHIENGIRYGFDVGRVMFCSGNTTERMRFAAVKARDEVVVDMFAGIGYFALPLAKHSDPRIIHALEKNPDSVAYLKLNAIQNAVAHIIKPQCGDNRVIGDDLGGRCDRVFMGYIPSCKEFLPRALFFLRTNEEGMPRGTIHYHFLADKPEAPLTALQDVRDALGHEVSTRVQISDLRCVKSYAPKRYHYVADLRFD